MVVVVRGLLSGAEVLSGRVVPTEKETLYA